MKFNYIRKASLWVVSVVAVLMAVNWMPLSVVEAEEGEIVSEIVVESPSPSPTASPVESEQLLPQPTASPSPSSTLPPSPSPSPTIEITQSQTASTSTDVSQTASTGSNSVIDQIKAELTTQSATSSSQIDNQINTNLLGQNLVQETVNLNTGGQGTVDLSDSLPTKPPDTPLSTQLPPPATDSATIIDNQAQVQNQVQLEATTGQNQVSAATARAETSDATANSQIFNQINTSLVGECGYFGVINIWESWQGDLVLPNPDEYLEDCQSSRASNVNPNQIEVTNTAEVTTDVTTSATTGENQVTGATEVVTGQATAQSQVVEKSNTTYTGDNWWLLRILNPENWHGQLVGAQVEPFKVGDTLYYGWLPNGRTGVGGTTLKINNDVTLQNSVDVTANTGRNKLDAAQSQLQTGDALARSQLISYLNTVLVGNRWYLADLNLLAQFTGDVILAQPDMALSAHASNTKLYVGQRQVIGFRVYNEGQSRALGVKVRVILPEGLKAIASQPGAQVDGREVTWSLGEMAAGGEYNIYLLIEAEKEMNELPIVATVSTDLTEARSDNNGAVTKVMAINQPVVRQRVVTQQISSVPTSQTRSIRSSTQISSQVAHSDDGGVLGATTDTPSNLVASLPTLNDATPSEAVRFCSRVPWVCQSTQYVFAGVMFAAYVYNKRRYIDWW